MHRVAEYIANNAVKYDLDPDEMFLLGWVHDIGYIYGKEDHKQNGRYLLGIDTDRIINIQF